MARYKAAITLHDEAKGRDALAEALRARAMTALTERKDALLAVRWAREGVAFNNDETTHALLADMLYAAHEYKDSVDEYRIALAGHPDDDTLEARARARAQEARRRKSRRAAARQGPRRREGGRRRGAGGRRRRARARQEPPPPSATTETTADEQK